MFLSAFLTAAITYEHGRKIWERTDDDREGLRDRLDERQKWRDVSRTLGVFGIEGKRLLDKSPVDKEALKGWSKRVMAYLEETLGEAYVFRFESGAGNEPNPPDHLRTEQKGRWIYVQARLMTLKEFVKEADERASRA